MFENVLSVNFIRTSIVIATIRSFAAFHGHSPRCTFDNDESIVYVIAYKTTDGNVIVLKPNDSQRQLVITFKMCEINTKLYLCDMHPPVIELDGWHRAHIIGLRRLYPITCATTPPTRTICGRCTSKATCAIGGTKGEMLGSHTMFNLLKQTVAALIHNLLNV